MELFRQVIHVDFVTLVTLLYLVLFMWFNRSFDKGVNQAFGRVLALAVLLVVSDNFDYYFSSQPVPNPVHPFFIMAGYILRVFLLLAFVFVLQRGELTRRKRLLVLVPALINAAIILTAPFNEMVFWIDSANVLHREPLSYAPHVASLIYFFYVLAIAIRRYRKGYRDEGLLLVIALASVLVAVIAEIALKTRGVLISAIMLMLTFYYLYLHMAHFKRDNLTGVLNRMSFYADVQNFGRDAIVALCEFDMNNLKAINDMQGHLAGDEAIVEVARVIEQCLPPDSYLYRLGGDEFAVLFCNTDLASVEATIDKVRAELAETPHTCAIGLAEWDDDAPFEDIYALADREMYKDKLRIKSA